MEVGNGGSNIPDSASECKAFQKRVSERVQSIRKLWVVIPRKLNRFRDVVEVGGVLEAYRIELSKPVQSGRTVSIARS